jgi:Xaa-Pro aminopeptidase
MRDVVPSVTEMPEMPKRAAHDEAPPQALLDFMVREWAPKASALEALVEAARFRARRERLSALFPGEALVVPTGHEKVRANDTTYRFRPGTDYYYLTGNLEADGVLVLVPRGEGHAAVLFVEPNPGKTDATFYTDRHKGELWVGPRLGVEESGIRFGTEARALKELAGALERVASEARAPLRLVRGIDPALDATVEARPDEDRALAAALSEMRLIKDDYEIRELEGAVASTQRAFDDVVRALAQATTERHVEGVFNLRARVEGNDVGYGTIAAAGAHACTLHWTANDGPLRAGDLLLLDAGVETNSLYTADVTRTIPLSGRFSPEQREIYELVLAAQRAAFAQCRPGNAFLAPNAAAMTVLAHGLARLGILPTTAEVALRETNQFYKRYSLHNVSHMLGLDVHDCAKARQETYRYGVLETGMVLTVEPGLYLQPDDLTVPQRYRGIGVRIEDDVVITGEGYRNLSAAIPSEADAVEAWVRGVAHSS